VIVSIWDDEEDGMEICSVLKPDELVIVNHRLHAVLTTCFRDLRPKTSRSPVKLIIRGRTLVDKAGNRLLGGRVWGRISRSFKCLLHAEGSILQRNISALVYPTQRLESSRTWLRMLVGMRIEADAPYDAELKSTSFFLEGDDISQFPS
jgi:hypothetical protein